MIPLWEPFCHGHQNSWKQFLALVEYAQNSLWHQLQVSTHSNASLGSNSHCSHGLMHGLPTTFLESLQHCMFSMSPSSNTSDSDHQLIIETPRPETGVSDQGEMQHGQYWVGCCNMVGNHWSGELPEVPVVDFWFLTMNIRLHLLCRKLPNTYHCGFLKYWLRGIWTGRKIVDPLRRLP